MSIEKQKLYNEIETLPEELANINFIEYLKLSYIDTDYLRYDLAGEIIAD